MKFRFFSRMALCLSAIFMMTSCVTDDDLYQDDYNYNPNVAYGSITNASPSSGDLYFYADENRVNTNALNYNVSAGYYNFYTGERTLTLKDATGAALATTDISLETGDFFSAFAVNTFDNIELITFRDSLAYPAQDQALVRFINLSPDAEAIDINGLNRNFVSGLEFKQATGFIAVNAGTYDISFEDSDTEETIYTQTTLNFYPGKVYTVYTKGFVTPPAGSNDTFSAEKITNL